MFGKNKLKLIFIQIVLTLTFILWTGSSIVQASNDIDMAQYFPLQVGNVWSFQETIDNEYEGISKESISNVINYKNKEVYLFGELDTGCWIPEIEAMSWDDQGLKFFGEIDCEDGKAETFIFDPPAMMCPRYLDDGQTEKWTSNGIEFEVQVMGTEDVQVPAGTFVNCLKVRSKMIEEGESEICEAWHYQSKGVVKEECRFEENGQVVEEETMELVAAVVDGQLIGNPLKQEELISFNLATAKASKCGLLVKNIVVKGQNGPELWWAGFLFDTNTAKWVLNSAGPGTEGSMPNHQCTLEGLDFTQSQIKLDYDDISQEPRLYILVPFQEKSLRTVFCFNFNNLSWELIYIQEHNS